MSITVRPLTVAQWREVESRLASQALFRARLLAGEMPAEIEQVFADCGTPLFPEPSRDLTMSCNCPDWGVPCKHLAAVCYVLAEAFDDDPFAMLAWRGKTRDDLLAALRGRRGPAGLPGRPARRRGPPRASPALALLSDVTGAPLEESLADFWSPGLSQARLRALPPSPVAPPDLLLRLGQPARRRGPRHAPARRPRPRLHPAGGQPASRRLTGYEARPPPRSPLVRKPGDRSCGR